MNYYITSGISDPTKQQPLLGGSLDFLQTANKEMVTAICRSIMGEALYNNSSTVAVCIAGCTFNSTLDTIFNGWIFFNGELYNFPGKTGLNSFGIAPVITADNTFLTPDPITMSDSTLAYVHQQRRLKCVDATLGSGLFNLKDMAYANSNNATSIVLAGFTTSAGTQQAITGASYVTPKGLVGMTRNFKIRLTGYLNYTFVTGSPEGAVLAIRNSTTSTDLSLLSNTTTAVAGMNAATTASPVSFEFRYANVPAGTTLIAAITRATANVTFNNGCFEVEEY